MEYFSYLIWMYEGLYEKDPWEYSAPSELRV